MIKDRFKLLLKHKTIQNIGYLTVGNILAQIISLIGAFYIPKLLGPEQYGIYNTVTVYVGMFTVLTFSGLNKVIIRAVARDLSKCKEILETTIGIRNLFSFLATLVALIVVLFVDYDKGTKLYIVVFSFSLLYKGLQNTVNTIYQAHEEMKVLAYVTITQQIVRVPLAILLLKNGYGVLSIIILQLAVQFIVLLINFFHSRKIVKFNVFSKINFHREYIKSGINFSFLGFLNTLSGKIDIVMLSFLTTPQNIGIYALAYNLVQKGLIIRKPISTSLFPYYTKKYNGHGVKIKDVFKHSLIIIIPALIIVFITILYSEVVIVSVIGKEFIESASILNVLIFYLVLNYALVPLSLVFQIKNKERMLVYIGALKAVLNISLNLIFFYFYGLIGIAYSTLVTLVIHLVLLIFFAKKTFN